jgi:hypothetical protein
MTITNKTKVLSGLSRENLPADIIHNVEPVVMKGLVNDWPLVQASTESPSAAVAYLKSFYNGKPSLINYGNPGIDGRYFYNDEMTGLNYETKKAQIDEALDLIVASAQNPQKPSYYISSNALDTHFPGMKELHPLALPRREQKHRAYAPDVKIWIGTRSVATCHYDALDNIACCVGGKRRFTLLPPSQFENLYFGPLELTPGGQAISMVDFANPDYEKYPRFKEAEAHAQIAELEPGDAIYIPSMWMHHVEGLCDFNILINFWWNDAPTFTGSGMNVLYHALLSLRDKPEHEKAGWKYLFDYYVFGDAQRAGAHLPEHARGYLGELDELKARQLRALLLNKLNR